MKQEDKKDKIEADPGRRTFMKRLWAGLGLVALLEFLGIGIAFMQPRKPFAKKGERSKIFVAGAVERFETGSVTSFRQGKFYLSRLHDGGFLALSRKCTHLGCTVPWVEEEGKFKCPCHSSSFDMTGNVTEPPAPRALNLYPVSIENNVVKVDTSRTIKRKRFEITQVTYP